MRKFAFQELAYATVVAAAYGLIIGIYVTSVTEIFDIRLPLYIFLWVFLICLHLGGIYLLVHLEKQQKKSKKNVTTKKETTD